MLNPFLLLEFVPFLENEECLTRGLAGMQLTAPITPGVMDAAGDHGLYGSDPHAVQVSQNEQTGAIHVEIGHAGGLQIGYDRVCPGSQ